MTRRKLLHAEAIEIADDPCKVEEVWGPAPKDQRRGSLKAHRLGPRRATTR